MIEIFRKRTSLLAAARHFWLALSMLSFAACGGGGGGKGGGGGNSMVTVSGTVSYQFVPPTLNCRDLNFSGTLSRPIRGATVQLLNSSGAVIASATSSDSGNYSFGNVAANTTVQIRVRAELIRTGSPAWDVEVRDNFVAGGSDNGIFPPAGLATRPLYTLDGAQFNTGSSNVTRDLTATTGWGGSSYTGNRAAAPFAILDTIYSGIQFVQSVDPGTIFPPLDAFWSVNNTITADDVDLTAGQLATSSYYFGISSLFILGDATNDTDEFDDHIVAHEWGHYFEDSFSRSESFGGAHFLGESLVASLAFGEGWASALGAMLLNDPIYCDTQVPGANNGWLPYDAENHSFGVRGWFNEVSVTALIYDLWDTANDGVDTGSIGFGPIYDVMTGPQFFTESITTLFSFASALRDSLNAPDAAFLDALLIRENVVSGAALDIWGTNESNAANINVSAGRDVEQTVLPLYLDYVAGDPALEVCVDNYLDGLDRDGNNVGEDRYLRITVPFDDEYDVDVITKTPTPPSADPDDWDQSDPDIYIIRGAGPEFIAFGATGTDGFEPTFRTPTLFAGETYVAIVEEWRFDDPEASTTYPSTICFDVSFTATP